jgi:hypothetical protein
MDLKIAGIGDRRKHVRKEVQWPVTILTAQGPVKGEAKNLSVEGLYIECSKRLHLHDIFPIYVEVDKPCVFMRGKVVWVRIKADDEGFPFYCMGISFVG